MCVGSCCVVMSVLWCVCDVVCWCVLLASMLMLWLLLCCVYCFVVAMREIRCCVGCVLCLSAGIVLLCVVGALRVGLFVTCL